MLEHRETPGPLDLLLQEGQLDFAGVQNFIFLRHLLLEAGQRCSVLLFYCLLDLGVVLLHLLLLYFQVVKHQIDFLQIILGQDVNVLGGLVIQLVDRLDWVLAVLAVHAPVSALLAEILLTLEAVVLILFVMIFAELQRIYLTYLL